MSKKIKVGYIGTEPNSISFSKNAIVLGKNVANYFRKKNISNLICIMDYENNSFILMEDNLHGSSITYPETNGNDFINLKLSEFFDLPLGFNHSYFYRAKPLNNNSVIVENFPLRRKLIAVGKRIYIDVDLDLIIFGRFSEDNGWEYNFSDKDLIKHPKLQTIPPKINNTLTSTPSQPQTQSIQSTSAPSQSKPLPKPMLDKEIGLYDSLNSPPENQPTPEEIERADKEYSKIILGE